MVLPAIATCGFASLGAYITRGVIAPRSQIYGRSIWHGPRDRAAIALTFDDGPTPGGTDAVLDILRKADVRAIFFVIGQNVEKYPDLLRRIHAEGHAIGNHTWHHHHHAWLGSKNYWEKEMRRTDELIERITGVRTRFFRPPIGIKTPLTFAAAKKLGYLTVTWSRRARDGVPTTPQNILRRVTDITAGDIAILHDGTSPNFPRNPAATIEALPTFLSAIKTKSLHAVSLDELLAEK